jgi:hypothetical protein
MNSDWALRICANALDILADSLPGIDIVTKVMKSSRKAIKTMQS